MAAICNQRRAGVSTKGMPKVRTIRSRTSRAIREAITKEMETNRAEITRVTTKVDITKGDTRVMGISTRVITKGLDRQMGVLITRLLE